MKPRPPTMREKHRYILARLFPWPGPDSKSLYLAVLEAVTSLFGDSGAARIRMAVVHTSGTSAIFRCRRGTEQDLMVALSTVISVGDRRVAISTRAVSGTIRSLKDCIYEEHTVREGREILVGGEPFVIVNRSGEQLDLIEKGFKNQKLLFLTTTDIEETECNHNTRWDTTAQ
jgi:ribonuclease P/MRP protein subunit POP5